jgi:tetrahydromethanopterin S-methyltransferase subunit B
VRGPFRFRFTTANAGETQFSRTPGRSGVFKIAGVRIFGSETQFSRTPGRSGVFKIAGVRIFKKEYEQA